MTPKVIFMSLKIQTIVGPGGKIELHAPGFQPGQRVELVIETIGVPSETSPADFLNWLETQPRQQRSAEEWAALDAELRAERDAWD
jgi:hypothetical protein